MRRLGHGLCDLVANAILNIRPTPLPAFAGMDAQPEAFEHGGKAPGPPVHFVTAELDAGPIVMQACVPVLDDDRPDTLAARSLVKEHEIYPHAIQRVLDGGWRIEGRRVIFPPD